MPLTIRSTVRLQGSTRVRNLNPDIKFQLYNASTDAYVRDLVNNDTIALGTDVPVLADVAIRGRSLPDDAVGSFRFDMSGASSRGSTENVAPYSLYGDNSGNYNPWGGNAGAHTLRGRTYTGTAQTGILLADLTISFTIV